jgi:hypothetical protein
MYYVKDQQSFWKKYNHHLQGCRIRQERKHNEEGRTKISGLFFFYPGPLGHMFLPKHQLIFYIDLYPMKLNSITMAARASNLAQIFFMIMCCNGNDSYSQYWQFY